MSFMEGFADAISTNIEDKRKRRRDQEDDMFETNYKVYLSRQEDQRKKSEQEKQIYGRAEFLAKRYGMDDRGSKVIFQYLNGGGKEEDLSEMLKEGSISFGDTPQPKAPMGETAQPSVPSAPSTSQEMKQSGLDVETVDSQEDSYVPKLETGRSPLAVNNMSPTEAKMTASQEKTVMKIAESTGRDEKEVRETLYGKSQQDLSPMLKWQFKPNSNQDLKWIAELPSDEKKLAIEAEKQYAMGNTQKGDQIKAIMNNLSKDGNQINSDGWMTYLDKDSGEMINVRGKTVDGVFYKKDGEKYEEKGTPTNVLDGMMIAIDDNLDLDTRKTIWNAVKPFQDQKNATLSIVRASDEASKIVDMNPAALTATARAVSSIQGLSNELDAVDRAIKEFGNSSMPSAEKEKVTDGFISRLKRITETADDSTLTDGQKRLLRLQMDMVYAQLKTYGETGRGVSNFDVKQQMFLIFDERPDRFKKHLQSNVKSQVDSLETSRKSTMETYKDVILQSRTQSYMNDSAQQQLVRLSGNNQDVVRFLDEASAIDTSSYRNEESQQTQPENKPVQSSAPVQVMNKQEYDNLQSGQEYIDPKGIKRRKQ